MEYYDIKATGSLKMPKYPNNLQFSLPSIYLEQLGRLSQENESLSLCAKRLLIGVLDEEGGSPEPKKAESLIAEINAIKERLDSLEERVNQLTLSPVKEVITDGDVAAMIGVNKSTASRWRRGIIKPNQEGEQKLSEAGLSFKDERWVLSR